MIDAVLRAVPSAPPRAPRPSTADRCTQPDQAVQEFPRVRGKDQRRAPHRVRQGWCPPHPPGRHGARRAVRPRREAPATSRCPPVSSPPRSGTAALNQVFTIDDQPTAPQALALPKAIQRDPIKDTFEHVDLIIVRGARRSPSTSRCTLIGEAARDTLVVHEHDTLSVIAEAHAPARPPRGLDRGPRGRLARSPPADVTLPEGTELAADPEFVLAVVTPAPTAEQLEGDTGRGRGRRGRDRRGRGRRGSRLAEVVRVGNAITGKCRRHFP